MSVVNKVVVKNVAYDIEDANTKQALSVEVTRAKAKENELEEELEDVQNKLNTTATELLKRIQGTSDNSSASNDPFKRYPTNFSSVADAEFMEALNTMHSTDSTSGVEGFWRLYIGRLAVEVKNVAIKYVDDTWVQTIKLPYKWYKSSNKFGIDDDGNHHIHTYYRIHKDDVWGEWIEVEEELKSAITAEETRAKAEEAAIRKLITDLIGESPETLDSIHEISSWILNDQTGAAAMAKAISENKTAIEAEVERAAEDFEALSNEIGREISARISSDNDIKTKAVLFGMAATRPNTNSIDITYHNVNQNANGTINIPAATTEKAGVMSAADKAKLDGLSEGGGSAVAELMQEVTYSELVEMRDNGNLLAGMKYRITDYVTTTVQANTKSANHQFDVIVEAVSENELSEQAQAIQHEGYTYFDGNDLVAWELWYCLNNDTSRFAWADAENGKGVIYRMIDEKRNDCPYDFKNILFYNINYTSNTTSDKYYYTFSYVVGGVLYDGTVEKQVTTCHSNSMGVYMIGGIRSLNKNTWRNNTFGNYCSSNTFGNYCNSNTFGNSTSNRKLDSKQTSITLNEEYYDDGTYALVPIKHPDLSTQPSILPYKFMGNYVYEQLVPIEGETTAVTLAVAEPFILEARLVGNGFSGAADVEYTNGELHIIASNLDKALYLKIEYTTMENGNNYYEYDY